MVTGGVEDRVKLTTFLNEYTAEVFVERAGVKFEGIIDIHANNPISDLVATFSRSALRCRMVAVTDSIMYASKAFKSCVLFVNISGIPSPLWLSTWTK